MSDGVSFYHEGIRCEITAGELEVMRLVAQGRTYAQAGKALGLSRHTVAYRVARVKDKLGAPTEIAAIGALCAAGLLGGGREVDR